MAASEIKTFPLGDFPLVSGTILPSAHIAYRTFGSPSSPAIVYPTWFSGSIADNEWLVGPGMALDPAHYFIIIPALFGNGQSTSPSNTSSLRPFPAITFRDNVTAQHRLVTEGLDIKHVRMVLGWSMGAGQTYQWITQFPDFMDLAVPFCGAARTSLHNKVFLEGVKSALLGGKGAVTPGVGVLEKAKGYRGWAGEEKTTALKAMGRVYAGWGFSQAFYREKLYETYLGFKDLEDFMVGFWEKWALSKGVCVFLDLRLSRSSRCEW
jgi:pimeloyl-ACP methyl ester carboxylesterase